MNIGGVARLVVNGSRGRDLKSAPLVGVFCELGSLSPFLSTQTDIVGPTGAYLKGDGT